MKFSFQVPKNHLQLLCLNNSYKFQWDLINIDVKQRKAAYLYNQLTFDFFIT